MIICNRYIATPLQTMTLRLRETLMSDSNQPTLSIAGVHSSGGFLGAYLHELLSSWLPTLSIL